MDFKEKIAILFEITFSGKNTEEINEAQKTLARISEDPSFLKALFDIISDSNKNPEMKARLKAIKKAATLYLKKFIDEKLESEEVKHDEIYFFSQIVCNGLYHEHISIDNKNQFLIMLNKLMINDLTNKIQNDLKSTILQSLNPNSLLENHQKTGVSLIVRAILGSLNTAVDISAFFNEIKVDLFQVVRNLMLFNTSDFKVLLRQLKVLKVWVETFRNFVLKLADLKSNAMENILLFPDVAAFSYEIIKMTFPLNKQLEDCMISTTNSKKLNDVLNEIKYKVLKYVNVLTKFLIDVKKEKNVLGKSNFYNMLPFLIELIYKSLIKYLAMEKESSMSLIDNKVLESLLIQSLIFLRCVCSLNEHNNFYQMNYQGMFFDLLLPFLIANSEEISLFQEAPEKFLSFTLESCYYNEKENIKSAACLLVQNLAHYVDGFLTFMFSLMKECLVFSLICNNLQELEQNIQNYPALKQFAYHKSFFLTNISPETRIETALLSFSILHEEIIKRNDLKSTLEMLIVNHEEALLNKKTTTEFIRARMSLLFGFYGIDLFSDQNNKTFFKYLRYVVNSVKSKKKSSFSITYLAIDSLMKTIFSKKLRKRNAALIKDIFKIFINKLPKINYVQFYDLILTILKNFRKTLVKNSLEDLLNLFRELVHLIISRLKKHVKKTHKKGLLLKYSFDILEEIISSKGLNSMVMEGELLVLYELLENPNKIRLEKEVFSLIVKMIETQGSISPALEKLFPILPNVFRINYFEMPVIFQVLNYYLYYGKGFVGNNMKTLEQIIELMTYSLLGNEEKSDDVNQALGALILHAIILNYHEILSFELWDKIFSKMMSRLEYPFQYRFLRGSICNIVWASFYTKFDVMQELFTKCDKLGNIMNFLTQESNIYTTVYDKKLFILGACAIFNSNFIQQAVVNYSSKIFDIMITNLVSLGESNKKKKPISNKIVTENEDDSYDVLEDLGDGDHSEADSLDNKLLDLQLEYTEEVNELYSFIHKVDEFECFQKMITGLKTNNIMFLQGIVSVLSETRQHELKDILQSKRVILDEKENTSVPRKILKVVGIKKL